jgi:hypothetical protein
MIPPGAAGRDFCLRCHNIADGNRMKLPCGLGCAGALPHAPQAILEFRLAVTHAWRHRDGLPPRIGVVSRGSGSAGGEIFGISRRPCPDGSGDRVFIHP